MVDFVKYVRVENPRCFLCGEVAEKGLFRSPVPKELTEPNELGILFENFHPVCRDCYDFKREVDVNFVALCKAVKLFELYRTTSKKRSEFFPQQLVFNVDEERVLDFYFFVLGLAEESWRVSGDDARRKSVSEDLNYRWRKKDD